VEDPLLLLPNSGDDEFEDDELKKLLLALEDFEGVVVALLINDFPFEMSLQLPFLGFGDCCCCWECIPILFAF